MNCLPPPPDYQERENASFYVPSGGVLHEEAVGGFIDVEEEPRPKANDRAGKGELREAELALRRRNESRCCLFSLSRSFFSMLLEERSRNRPAPSILADVVIEDDAADGSDTVDAMEKLNDERELVCVLLRENRLDVDDWRIWLVRWPAKISASKHNHFESPFEKKI